MARPAKQYPAWFASAKDTDDTFWESKIESDIARDVNQVSISVKRGNQSMDCLGIDEEHSPRVSSR